MMSEKPVPGRVSEAELAVLRRLWVRGETTARVLTDDLYPGGEHAHYATVQSLLGRLEAKGCARRRKQGRLNVYAATVTRSDLLRRRLRETAEALCDGSLAPLLSSLVRDVDLTDDELRALERLVARLDRPGKIDR